MEWCKKHLHLTWLFYMIVALPLIGIILMLVFGLNGRTAGSVGAYVWLMITPFPINIWLLNQKGRNWVWSLFGLWTLCWIPLVLKNKNTDEFRNKQVAEKLAQMNKAEEDLIACSKQKQPSSEHPSTEL